MPAYDPDAELNGLAFTVGAWVKAITRVKENTNFPASTSAGKSHLHQALSKLLLEVNALNASLEVDSDE